MKTFLVLCFFCSVISLCFSSIEKKRRCHQVTPVSSFNLSKFSTTWYTIVKSNPLVDANDKCVHLDVSAINSTNANVTTYAQNIWSNKEENGTTHLQQKYPNITGILQFGPRYRHFSVNVTIVDVVYNNYVVVHVCKRIKCFWEYEQAYILSAKPTLAQQTVNAGKKKLESFGFKTDHFFAVDQIDC